MIAKPDAHQPLRCLPCLLFIGLACSILTIGQAADSRITQAFTVNGETWDIRLPQGMQLELLTDRLDGPRLMNFLPNGELLIGSKSGNVYHVEDPSSLNALRQLDHEAHQGTSRERAAQQAVEPDVE